MKKGTRKALLALCCAMILVAISVGATLAYLTDSEAVTNTFTVGQVGLSLDEAPVDEDGKATDGTRVTENEYHLLPGQTYDKDPTVHVDAGSEDSWLFVKVENGIAPIEDKAAYTKADGTSGTGTIAEQMAEFGWQLVPGQSNVYYHTTSYDKDANPAKNDFVVFKAFKISGKAHNQPQVSAGAPANDEHNKFMLAQYATEDNGTAIKVTAYAIQMAGFDSTDKTDAENAAAAWAAGKFA